MNIIIYNTTFFEGSETFIYNQVNAIVGYGPFLVATSFNNLERFPINDINRCIAVSQIPKSPIDRLLHFVRRKLNGDYYRLPPKSENVFSKLISENRIECIHAHFGPNGLNVLPVAKKYKIPLVVSFHGYDASQLLDSKSYVHQLKKLSKYSFAFVVCAEYMKVRLLEYLGEKVSDKIHVINYGVDTKKIATISNFEHNESKLRIIHAGRFALKKGVLDLITVFSEVLKLEVNLNLMLDLVGDGTQYIEAKELVSTLGVENNVRFYGALPHNELIALVKAADIFVLNSRVDQNGDSEGLPNAILEAMACKTSVVSTKHSGIPEIIKHRKTGYLVEEKNNSQLKNAILELVESKTIRDEISENAFYEVIQNYTIEEMQKKLQNLISHL